MNNEEKILEMLAAMQTRQEKTEEMLAAMQGSITTMQGDIVSMQGDIKNINGRLDSIEEKLDDLTEAHEVTRDGVNALLEWGDEVSGTIAFPIPKMNL